MTTRSLVHFAKTSIPLHQYTQIVLLLTLQKVTLELNTRKNLHQTGLSRTSTQVYPGCQPWSIHDVKPSLSRTHCLYHDLVMTTRSLVHFANTSIPLHQYTQIVLLLMLQKWAKNLKKFTSNWSIQDVNPSLSRMSTLVYPWCQPQSIQNSLPLSWSSYDYSITCPFCKHFHSIASIHTDSSSLDVAKMS